VTAVVVLADATDRGASLVASRVARRIGGRSVRLLRPEELALARWSQRIASDGRASTRLTLRDTETIDGSQVRVLLNRVRLLEPISFRRASPKDRDYAAAELHAVVASWLAELGDRAVPSARRHPWVVPPLSELQWRRAAADVDLPLADMRVANAPRFAPRSVVGNDADDHVPAVPPDAPTAGSILVAGRRTTGFGSPRIRAACRALGERLGYPLLECRFTPAEPAPVLCSVDPRPSLEEPWAAETAARFLVDRLPWILQ